MKKEGFILKIIDFITFKNMAIVTSVAGVAAAATIGVHNAAADKISDSSKTETSVTQKVNTQKTTAGKESGETTAIHTEKSESEKKEPQVQKIKFEKLWKAGAEEYNLISDKWYDSEDGGQSADDFLLQGYDFVVPYPEDYTAIYLPDWGGNYNPGTRDISQEYYFIRNIDTGVACTVDGYTALCMILAGEVGSGWSMEALKAQAVSAYTYLRYCDACGIIPSLGLKTNYDDKIRYAVESVEGQCIYYDGGLINAVFSASSAGITASSADVWGGYQPYLQAVYSEYDQYDPNYGIKTSFSAEDIKNIIKEKWNIDLGDDPTQWFRIDSVYSGKYVSEMSVGGYTHINGQRITGNMFRSQIVGSRYIKSPAFAITYSDGTFTFVSYGFGHGVGLSQWGANLYAIYGGYSYDQILRHYYIDTYIAVSDPSEKALQRAEATKEELEKEMEQAKEDELMNSLVDESSMEDNSSENSSENSDSSTDSTENSEVTESTENPDAADSAENNDIKDDTQSIGETGSEENSDSNIYIMDISDSTESEEEE